MHIYQPLSLQHEIQGSREGGVGSARLAGFAGDDLERFRLRAQVGHLGGVAVSHGRYGVLEALDLEMRALQRVLGRRLVVAAALRQEGVGLLRPPDRQTLQSPCLEAPRRQDAKQARGQARAYAQLRAGQATSRLLLSSFLSLPLAFSFDRFLSSAARTLAHSPFASLPFCSNTRHS